MNDPDKSTLKDPEAARNLLRSFVEDRYPAGSYRRLDDELLLGGHVAWVLEHDGGFALIRVPSVEQTILSMRAGIAIEIPRSEELAYYVASANRNVMAGRVFMAYGDQFALVVLEEIVWGQALSWAFQPSVQDVLNRFTYVIKQAAELRSTILERFGGRPFEADEWIHLAQ